VSRRVEHDCFSQTASADQPGDHVLFDGFGAGSYYDVLAVDWKLIA